jgi:hypothetical protein
MLFLLSELELKVLKEIYKHSNKRYYTIETENIIDFIKKIADDLKLNYGLTARIIYLSLFKDKYIKIGLHHSKKHFMLIRIDKKGCLELKLNYKKNSY